MKRRLGAAGLAALLLAACRQGTEPDPPASAENSANGAAASPASKPKDPLLVRAAAVTVAPIERKLEATAHIESLDAVDVVAERSEPVVEVLVEEGEQVQAGQVLARLRDELARLDVEQARVRLAGANNQLTQAEKDHERNRNLAADTQGGPALLSQRDLDASEERLLSARNLVDADQVALHQAEVELRRCTIVAPIGGTVTERMISLGDTTTLGSVLFRVIDLSHPKAVFFRPQRELADLQVGQPLVATSEALPGTEIPGKVERISPAVDPVSGTVKVTAALEPGERVLPVGVLVRLKLVLDRKDDALLVPKRALLFEGPNVVCFVLRTSPEDGTPRVARIVLRPGYEDPQFLEALPAENGESGLGPDDRVVVVGADRLADGDRVQIAAE